MRRKLILPIFDKYEDAIQDIIDTLKGWHRLYRHNINKFPFDATMYFDNDEVLSADISSCFDTEIVSVDVAIKSRNGIPTKAEYNRCIKKLQNAYKEWVNNLYEVQNDIH